MSVQFTTPGVYIQELTPTFRAIEGASTAIAAFFGQTERGPHNKPVLVKNMDDFEERFGWHRKGYHKDSFLAYAVQGFFDNGGQKCYIVRPDEDTDDGTGSTAEIVVPHNNTTPINIDAVLDTQPNYKIFAGKSWKDNDGSEVLGEKGAWGNDLKIKIKNSSSAPLREFGIDVYRGDAKVESIDDLSPVEGTSNYFKDVINKTSNYISADIISSDSASFTYDQSRVRSAGFFISGPHSSAPSYPTPPPPDEFDEFEIKVDDSPFLAIKFTSPLPLASDIATEIQAQIRSYADSHPEYYTSLTDFVCNWDGDSNRFVLISGTHDSTGTKPGSAYSSIIIRPRKYPESEKSDVNNDRSKALLKTLLLQTIEYEGTLPSEQAYYGSQLVSPLHDYTTFYDSTGSLGIDITKPTSSIYKDSFKSLDVIYDVSLISVPGNGESPETRIHNEGEADAIISAGINYCKNRDVGDCFFIADPPKPLNPTQQIQNFANGLSTRSDYGALFYPWVETPNRMGTPNNPNILVPPSGFIAGVCSRIDSTRGVWKAPAGLEAGVASAVGLSHDLTNEEQGLLNPISVNVIRKFPGQGIVVWGSRTLTPDIVWRYISVRRMANFLKVSLFNGLKWATFEPNDTPLWASMHDSIYSFMLDLFEKGAFQGNSPKEAFFVKCDADTNPQINIDRGIVTARVGFAALKPAEFVYVTISQKINQGA